MDSRRLFFLIVLLLALVFVLLDQVEAHFEGSRAVRRRRRKCYIAARRYSLRQKSGEKKRGGIPLRINNDFGDSAVWVMIFCIQSKSILFNYQVNLQIERTNIYFREYGFAYHTSQIRNTCSRVSVM